MLHMPGHHKEGLQLLISDSRKDRGGEHCVASARAAANETRKMITGPRIYECLLQRTMSSHLNYSCTSVQRPSWGQKEVAIVERLKPKWMYGLSAQKNGRCGEVTVGGDSTVQRIIFTCYFYLHFSSDLHRKQWQKHNQRKRLWSSFEGAICEDLSDCMGEPYIFKGRILWSPLT